MNIGFLPYGVPGTLTIGANCIHLDKDEVKALRNPLYSGNEKRKILRKVLSRLDATAGAALKELLDLESYDWASQFKTEYRAWTVGDGYETGMLFKDVIQDREPLCPICKTPVLVEKSPIYSGSSQDISLNCDTCGNSIKSTHIGHI